MISLSNEQKKKKFEMFLTEDIYQKRICLSLIATINQVQFLESTEGKVCLKEVLVAMVVWS